MYGKEAGVLKLKSILKSPNYVGVLLVEFSVMCFSQEIKLDAIWPFEM